MKDKKTTVTATYTEIEYIEPPPPPPILAKCDPQVIIKEVPRKIDPENYCDPDDLDFYKFMCISLLILCILLAIAVLCIYFLLKT